MHQFTLFFLAATILGQSHLTRADDAACDRPPAVEAFASAVYAAQVVTTDPDVLRSLSATGKEAADYEYDLCSAYLSDRNVCNADRIALEVALGIVGYKNVTLDTYLKKTADEIGRYMLKHGGLLCGNAVSLALDYFQHIQGARAGLDETKFRSYMQGHVNGLFDWVQALGFPLDKAAQDLADAFADEFGGRKPGNCSPQ